MVFIRGFLQLSTMSLHLLILTEKQNLESKLKSRMFYELEASSVLLEVLNSGHYM